MTFIFPQERRGTCKAIAALHASISLLPNVVIREMLSKDDTLEVRTFLIVEASQSKLEIYIFLL